MFSTLAKWTGQLVGETVHQADSLYESTKAGANSAWDDICEIPEQFSKGYDEEIFEPVATATTKLQTTHAEPADI